ncbi:hypothetical protein K502DRAFT_351084 [Neoconidiobolus thromboides FSU 785]|nr:hypothetical protein K502DRAFT_351084 [Neoconidiobolus thromboides FSU 785]
MFLLLLLFNFLSYSSIELSPRADDGGCIIIQNKLYYLGGVVQLPNLNYMKNNTEVFHLDLEKGFKLVDNIAPWKRKDSINSPKEMANVKLFKIGKENKIIVSFYTNSMERLYFNYYDINKNEWNNEYWIKDLFNKDQIKMINKHEYQLYPFISQDDTNPKQFYITGRLFLDGLKTMLPLRLSSFNIETKKIQKIYDLSDNITIYPLLVLNKNFYYSEISGGGGPKGPNKVVLNEVNLLSFKVKAYPMKHFINPYSTYFVKNSHQVYFAGFSYSPTEEKKITVSELKFNPFSLKEYTPNTNNLGCFAFYKDFLINSFGKRILAPGSNQPEESSDKIQILNITNWKEIDGLLSLAKDNENNKSVNSTNKQAIETKNDDNAILIGGIIGGIAGAIVLTATTICMLYRYKQRKGRAPSMILEPIVNEPTNPLDINSNYNSALFNHYHEVDDGSSVVPEKSYIKNKRGECD